MNGCSDDCSHCRDCRGRNWRTGYRSRLSEKGLERSDLYEQSNDIRILGASIYIWENGLRVLEALGVFDRVVADAVQVRMRERRDADGELFGIEDTASSGRLYLPLRRALLTSLQQEVLTGGGEIYFGMPAVGADASGILKFADGTSTKADLVIGADGINSRVRDSLDMLEWREAGRPIRISDDDQARSGRCERRNPGAAFANTGTAAEGSCMRPARRTSSISSSRRCAATPLPAHRSTGTYGSRHFRISNGSWIEFPMTAKATGSKRSD